MYKRQELSLQEIRKQMTETEKQIKQLEKQERVQKAKLAQQIDAIYRSGVNPSTLERMLSDCLLYTSCERDCCRNR